MKNLTFYFGRIPLFPLGRIVATPSALTLLSEHNISAALLLDRHGSGDWGNLDQCDKAENQNALVHMNRILSSYDLGVTDRIWIITEADRSSTTILLPEDY